MQVLPGRRSAFRVSIALFSGIVVTATVGCGVDSSADALTAPVSPPVTPAVAAGVSPSPILIGLMNEPAGMTPFIYDNGSVREPIRMVATDPWTGLNGWGTTRTALVGDLTNPTGSGLAIEKRWTTGMPTDAAAKPGLISVWHWSSLNSSFHPAKTLYVRMRVWFSSNWPEGNGNLAGMKFFYLKTSKTNTNLMFTSKWPDGRVHWASLTKHGAKGNYFFDTWSKGQIVHPLGAWHTVEFVFTMNSALDKPDGRVQMWGDGVLVSDRTGVIFVGASDTGDNLDFDGMQFYPLRGTVHYTFDRNDQFRIGELYVSGK